MLLLAATATPQYHPDDLKHKVIAFEEHYDVFVRGLFGCDATGEIGPDICRPHAERIDRKAFEKARKAAAKLFDFKE